MGSGAVLNRQIGLSVAAIAFLISQVALACLSGNYRIVTNVNSPSSGLVTQTVSPQDIVEVTYPDQNICYSPVDITMVVMSGQSNSAGDGISSIDTTQPYSNVVLYDSLGIVNGYNISQPDAGTLSLIPAICPERTPGDILPDGGEIVTYPHNIEGFTSDVAVANELTSLALSDGFQSFKMAISNEGVPGAPMSAIQKGGTNNSYAAGIYEVNADWLLSSPQTLAPRAVLFAHGESDNQNSLYQSELVTMQADYQTDIQSVTGQTLPVIMIERQQQSEPSVMGGINESALQQLDVTIANPNVMILSSPDYQCPLEMPGSIVGDGVHYNQLCYAMIGEKMAEAFYRNVVRGQNWNGIYPINFSRATNIVTITFNVPLGMKIRASYLIDVPGILQFDSTVPLNHQTGDYSVWANGYGFEAYDNLQEVTAVASGSPWIFTIPGHDLATNDIIGVEYQSTAPTDTAQKLFTVTVIDSNTVSLQGTTPSSNSFTGLPSSPYWNQIWQPITIESAVIQNGNQVVLTLSRAPTRNLVISYAHHADGDYGTFTLIGATGRSGNLRDGDPFCGRSCVSGLTPNNFNWGDEFSQLVP